MPEVAGTHKGVEYYQKHRVAILSFVLAVYCLPPTFYRTPGAMIEASWKKALNYCVSSGFTFGQDFIFTYGPLGYLSSRYGQYINPACFVAFDLFIAAGFFTFFYRNVTNNKGWFIVSLASVVMLRQCNYSQVLFSLFIAHALSALHQRLEDRFAISFCAASGILLFFIKVNYGIISLGIVVTFLFVLLLKRVKYGALFGVAALVFFFALYLYCHIHLPGYLKYGYLLAKHFDEAMSLPAGNNFPLAWCIVLCIAVAGTAMHYCFAKRGIKNTGFYDLGLAAMVFGASYLFYRNGFTRADNWHWADFFYVYPFFAIAVLSATGHGRTIFGKAMAGGVLAVSFYGNAYIESKAALSPVPPEYLASFKNAINPFGYFRGFADDSREFLAPGMQLPEEMLADIGKNTVDIFPFDIQVLLQNRLNYQPRPIPQSYTAYSDQLDALNAAHFSKPHRPEFVVIQNLSIDSRYAFWDECVTKTALHFNYKYSNFLGYDGNGIAPDALLVLRAQKASSQVPVFTKIHEVNAQLGKEIPINFPLADAIYFSAEVRYSAAGKLRRVMYQPPGLSVRITTLNGNQTEYKAVLPILESKLLISHTVNTALELKNFIDGNISMNTRITGVTFNALANGFQPDIHITFYKLSNY